LISMPKFIDDILKILTPQQVILIFSFALVLVFILCLHILKSMHCIFAIFAENVVKDLPSKIKLIITVIIVYILAMKFKDLLSMSGLIEPSGHYDIFYPLILVIVYIAIERK